MGEPILALLTQVVVLAQHAHVSSAANWSHVANVAFGVVGFESVVLFAFGLGFLCVCFIGNVRLDYLLTQRFGL